MLFIINHCTLLAPRRKPSAVISDDEDDDDNSHQNSSPGSERDENPDGEDDLSEGDNDLSGLNSASLRKKISSEVKSLVFILVYI